MKILLLTIGALVSLLSAAVWFILGLQAQTSSNPEIGYLMIFIGVPVALANAIVFDFVRKALKEKETEEDAVKGANKTGISSNLRGTPWERNPRHTLK